MKHLDYLAGIFIAAVMVAASWLGWLPYSMVETLGFVTGAACVYLVVKQNVLNFPIGIANNIFFIILFLDARLYGDAWLQVIYVALGAQGWYWWLRGGQNRTALKVARASARHLIALAALVVLCTIALTLILRAARGAAPVLDAFTTVLSLAAQYLLNRKLIENWYAWITADVIYIYLYISRGLHLTAILYFVFLCLCIAGFIKWRESLARDEIRNQDELAMSEGASRTARGEATNG